jgi:hypothetical protein
MSGILQMVVGATYSVPDLGRGVFGGGGEDAGTSNVMDYITIATTGNATDFGDLTVAVMRLAGVSNGSRGVFAVAVRAQPPMLWITSPLLQQEMLLTLAT